MLILEGPQITIKLNVPYHTRQWKSWSDFVNLDAIQREKVEPLFISKVYFCLHSGLSVRFMNHLWKHNVTR